MVFLLGHYRRLNGVRMRLISYQRHGKRILDIVVSVFALIALAPVMFVIALLVRTKLGTPILFCQLRPGINGKPFTLYKFRTMTDARDVQGNLLSDTERLTRLGMILRKSSLDELPELFNVLLGQLSIVGPRPLLMRYTPYFTEQESVRFTVRPGITGLAQVSGRNDLTWDSRIALDVKYVADCTLRLDLKIILMTLGRVLSRHGVQVDPGAVMLDFDEERRRRLEQRL